ncbi:MAG: beta-barrel fold lipoprotein [Phocaeicola sp.]|uniref:beta-barrel fold lipoprotein n=1 Tax=Phocaeicola sp. TaxID=2773926 RepID=UPI003FA1803A
MKKTYFMIAAMTACLSLPMLFTSCGSDHDDGIEAINTESSVVRMELSLSGDYARFNPIVSFHAWDLKGKGMDIRTSTGKDVNMMWDIMYEDSPFSTAAAQIKGSYSAFYATLILSNADAQDGKVSVQATVYKDEKVIRHPTLDIDIMPTDGNISIGYSPEEGFTRLN